MTPNHMSSHLLGTFMHTVWRRQNTSASLPSLNAHTCSDHTWNTDWSGEQALDHCMSRLLDICLHCLGSMNLNCNGNEKWVALSMFFPRSFIELIPEEMSITEVILHWEKALIIYCVCYSMCTFHWHISSLFLTSLRVKLLLGNDLCQSL